MYEVLIQMGNSLSQTIAVQKPQRIVQVKPTSPKPSFVDDLLHETPDVFFETKAPCQQQNCSPDNQTALCAISTSPALRHFFKSIRLHPNLSKSITVSFQRLLYHYVRPWILFLRFLLFGTSPSTPDESFWSKLMKKTPFVDGMQFWSNFSEEDKAVISGSHDEKDRTLLKVVIWARPLVNLLVDECLRAGLGKALKSPTLQRIGRTGLHGRAALFAFAHKLLHELNMLITLPTISLQELLLVVGELLQFIDVIRVIFMEIESLHMSPSLQGSVKKILTEMETHAHANPWERSIWTHLKSLPRLAIRGLISVVGLVKKSTIPSQMVMDKLKLSSYILTLFRPIIHNIRGSWFQRLRNYMESFGFEITLSDALIMYDPSQTIHNQEWISKTFDTQVQYRCFEDECSWVEIHEGIYTLYAYLGIFGSFTSEELSRKHIPFRNDEVYEELWYKVFYDMKWLVEQPTSIQGIISITPLLQALPRARTLCKMILLAQQIRTDQLAQLLLRRRVQHQVLSLDTFQAGDDVIAAIDTLRPLEVEENLVRGTKTWTSIAYRTKKGHVQHESKPYATFHDKFTPTAIARIQQIWEDNQWFYQTNAEEVTQGACLDALSATMALIQKDLVEQVLDAQSSLTTWIQEERLGSVCKDALGTLLKDDNGDLIACGNACSSQHGHCEASHYQGAAGSGIEQISHPLL